MRRGAIIVPFFDTPFLFVLYVVRVGWQPTQKKKGLDLLRLIGGFDHTHTQKKGVKKKGEIFFVCRRHRVGLCVLALVCWSVRGCVGVVGACPKGFPGDGRHRLVCWISSLAWYCCLAHAHFQRFNLHGSRYSDRISFDIWSDHIKLKGKNDSLFIIDVGSGTVGLCMWHASSTYRNVRLKKTY